MLKRFLLLLSFILLIQSNTNIENHNVLANRRCFLPPSVSEEVKRSTAVFSGKVVAQEYIPIKNPTKDQMEDSEELIIKIEVHSYWKGDLGKEVVLYTGEIAQPDGITTWLPEAYHFEVGKEYLIYTYGSQDQLRTDRCRRTTSIDNAQADLKALGAGKNPNKNTD